VYGEAASLEPAGISGSLPGVYGGMELAAIYDVLMRYNPKTGEYEPQLAKALEHNDDHTTWTLTLRDGVKFSDGTSLDAQAVKSSINRYVEQGGSFAPYITRFVDK